MPGCKVLNARSRSRSGRDCHGAGAHGGISYKKATAEDSTPPPDVDVPAECSRKLPPPTRPAGPFALFFAANHATTEAKDVMTNIV